MSIGPFSFNSVANAINEAAKQAGDAAKDAADAAMNAAGQAAAAAGEAIEDGVVMAKDTAQAAGAFAIGAFSFATDISMKIGAMVITGTADQATMGPELISLRQRMIDANEGEPAERKHDTPEEAAEYRDLSIAIYGNDQEIPEGYEEIPVEEVEAELGVDMTDPETGLKARVYKKDDVYVLVFEGSTMNGEDWGTNITQGGGAIPKQYRQAADIALRFKEVYGERGDLVVTGHSLGGGLATFAGLGAGIETYTFNTSGIGPGAHLLLDSAGLVGENQHLIKNYIQRGEALSIVRVGLDAVTNVLFRGLPALLGYGGMQLIGETELIGSYGMDPVTAHNEPDMSTVR